MSPAESMGKPRELSYSGPSTASPASSQSGPVAADALPSAPDHNWQFQLRAGDAWDAMYADCAAAETSIDFEQYIMRSDGCGRRFARMLMDKARDGLRVRLLCDMLGSYDFYVSDLPNTMRAAGCDVRFYNPLSPWRMKHMASWSRRDHRKMIVVDGRVAHIGSVCLDDAMCDWRETHIRIVGPVVLEVEHAFRRLWADMEGAAPPMVDRRVGADDVAFVTNEPHVHRNPLYRHFLMAAARAQNYIYLTTPYYVPDQRFARRLRRASRRGVDVRLLVPEHPDHPIVHSVSRSYWGAAIKGGIRVYAYLPTMIHAKTIVVDDRWATVGSSNLDYLSFFGNQEGNLIATKQAFALDLKHQFLEDLRHTREVTLEEWSNRPYIERIAGRLGRPIKKFL